jgi:DNA (cytosine-5)-methyltransferase 1
MSGRPRLLDLFSGAGGAGMGYKWAGFDVTGVDIEHHHYPPGEFYQADAVEFVKQYGHEFDAIHASPPCQRYSTMTRAASRDNHPDLVPVMRDLLVASGRPWVIENVVGSPLLDPVRLCGSFEASFAIPEVPCDHKAQGQAVGVYGNPERREYRRPDGSKRGRKAGTTAEARTAMGIDWMEWHDLTEAIPPAYTEHIGRQLLEVL